MPDQLHDDITIDNDPQSPIPDSAVSPADNCPSTTDNPSPGPTGPRTPEGKAVSSQNALKLGLSIQRHVVLPFEDPRQYQSLRDAIHAIYAPLSERERLAVDDIAHCRWAFRRFDEAELIALDKAAAPYVEDPSNPYTYGQALGGLAEPQRFEPGRYSPDIDQKPRPMLNRPLWLGLDQLHRYRTWWERRHQRAITEYERARQSRRQETRDRQREEWHQTRMAAAHRREQRDHQRHQHAQATERRRQDRHTSRMALESEQLRQQKAITASLQPLPTPPQDFVPQTSPHPAKPTKNQGRRHLRH